MPDVVAVQVEQLEGLHLPKRLVQLLGVVVRGRVLLAVRREVQLAPVEEEHSGALEPRRKFVRQRVKCVLSQVEHQ